ncbi:restriction endonuclease subunit S [Streptomyces sp. CA-243310]|uniref:restriction endonuclease subunit S n=1 Tax=Streptomyces sp. CA-243310 TaxID=3240056 RepID=UPI003D8EE2DC
MTEALADLAAMSDNLEAFIAMPGGMKRLRQVISDAAIRGLLTKRDGSEGTGSDFLTEVTVALLEMPSKVAISRRKRERQAARKKAAKLPEPFPVPEHWTWAPFGELVFNLDGVRVPLSVAEREGRRGQYDYYGASGVIDSVDDFLFDGDLLLVSEDGANLVNRSTPIAFVATGKYWVNNHAHVVDTVHPETMAYLALFLNSIDLKPYVTGTAQPKMNQTRLSSIPVPVPPLGEQRRIVDAVHERFAILDQLLESQASANAVRNKLSLVAFDDMAKGDAEFALSNMDSLVTSVEDVKRLKTALLDLAVRGLLVRQDPSETPAAGLDTSGAPDLPFGLPAGWCAATVKQVLEPDRDISYGVIKLGPEPTTGGVPTLRCSDVKFRRLELRTVRRVDPSIEKDFVRTRLVGGEVVINVRGTLGGVARIPESIAGYNVAREVAVVPVGDQVDPDFLVCVFSSGYFWKLIQANLRGIAYVGLNLGTLRQMPIPVPPLAEQRRIVKELDERMVLCDALEAILPKISIPG